MGAYFFYLMEETSQIDLLERLNELKKVLNTLENKLEVGKGFYAYENFIIHQVCLRSSREESILF